MKLGTPTLVVLSMFASFGVVLGVMIYLFQDGRRTRPRESPPPAPRVASAPSPSKAAPAPEREKAGEVPETTPDTVRSPVASASSKLTHRGNATDATPAGAKAQREIEREREELALLRKAMEKRLREQEEAQKKKIEMLARQIRLLEPGAAADILKEFDDPTIKTILGQLERERAIAIAAVLDRLGRPNALALP